jgi:YNFM family putative membrane transporter
MGLYISGNAIGGMSGRLIAGVLTDFVGWRGGVAVVAAVGIACALAFWRLLPPSRHFTPQRMDHRALAARFNVIFHDRGLPWLFVEGFLLLGSFVTVYNYLGYRLLAPPYNFSQAIVGAIFAIYLIGTFSSPWVGHLAGKLGRRKVLWTMLALILVGTLLTLLASIWAILLGVVALTFGFFGGHSVVSSWVGRRAGAAKAHASSLYLFCYYMGSSIAGACGGLFYASDGWKGVVWFVGAMALLGLLIALGLYRLPPLPQNTATPPTPMSRGAMP